MFFYLESDWNEDTNFNLVLLLKAPFKISLLSREYHLLCLVGPKRQPQIQNLKFEGHRSLLITHHFWYHSVQKMLVVPSKSGDHFHLYIKETRHAPIPNTQIALRCDIKDLAVRVGLCDHVYDSMHW